MATRKPAAKTRWIRSRYDGVRMSAREFRKLPEEKPYLEYINGVVEQKPMANSDHRNLVGRLDGHFFLYTREHGGKFGPESRVEIDPTRNYYLPDTGFWIAGIPSGDDTVPTLAVEVRSPGQSLPTLREKCRNYLQSGSSVAWIVDPERRLVEVVDGAGTRTLSPEDVLTCDAMPGFELAVAELFAALDS